jgi:hypothetical protein
MDMVLRGQNTGLSVDLHVHTALSTCYREKGTTAERIVDAAIDAGLDAVAITDHNTTAAVDQVKCAAANRGLVVFPGVEVSTAWGHVLAIFDADAENSAVDGMLERIGITPDAGGDGGRLSKCQMDEVFRAISEAGGLAIAAHVDRWPTGVLHAGISVGDRVRLLSSDYLSAIEITIPGDRSLWNEGRIANISTRLACIQSSDAHAPGEIGRRRVVMKMNNPTLDGIRDALSNYATAVVFPE